MNTRERFRACMAFEPFDRLPAIESYWYWDQTLARWHGEGLPASLVEHPDVAAHLGLDTHHIFWVSPAWRMAFPPGRGYEEGRVRSLAEYEEYVTPALATIEPDLNRPLWEHYRETQQRGEAFIWLQLDGFFWFPRQLLGIEPQLYAFYDHPEWLHRINDELVDYTLRLLEALFAVLVPDVISFAEDMAYNNGPMLSEDCFDTFLAPYYRRVLPLLRQHDVLPIVDSDGDLAAMIPWLQRVGLRGATPLERRAGNDLNALRARHPQFCFLGGFDKTVMHRGEAALRAEFERLLPVMQSGGYIPSCDHQTPPEVSLDDYRLYVKLLHEYVRRAGTGA